MSLGSGASSFRVGEPESRVVTVHWPGPERDLVELARLHIPRLFLVAPDSAPPTCSDCLEDWVRLPVDDIELRARLDALAAHGHRHGSRVRIDEFGLLHHGDMVVILSPREARLADLLIRNFDSVVRDEQIDAHVFESEHSSTSLRVQVSRLRKRVGSLGLTITSIRGVGYIMHRLDDASRTSL